MYRSCGISCMDVCRATWPPMPEGLNVTIYKYN